MLKILIIDDDESTLELLSIYLSKEGYKVDSAINGREGLEKYFAKEYQLVLLDIMMPEMNGLETIKAIRKRDKVPIIFMTAKDTVKDRIQGFLLGCDDYIIKPFDLMEMKLRIQAVLNRTNQMPVENHMIYIDDLIINELEHSVVQNGNEIKLTAKEFDIMLLLAKNQGRVFSVSEMYERIWEEPFFENDRSVLTHIGNIRNKLGDSVKKSRYIKTIWGVGYKIGK